MDGWMDACMHAWMDGWMDDLLFYILFNCIGGWVIMEGCVQWNSVYY